MTQQTIAAALQRATAVLERRPDFGLHDDVVATARWQSGTRVVSSHPNGTQLQSDMPTELGGSGDQVSPGWLFRAGLASCLATCIVLRAAADGIELTSLDVRAASRSDTRGLLGMADATGGAVAAAPLDMQLLVRIAAHGVAPERLRALVAAAHRCAPIPNAVQQAVPVEVSIDVEDLPDPRPKARPA